MLYFSDKVLCFLSEAAGHDVSTYTSWAAANPFKTIDIKLAKVSGKTIMLCMDTMAFQEQIPFLEVLLVCSCFQGHSALTHHSFIGHAISSA
jgi:hypothetical protein